MKPHDEALTTTLTVLNDSLAQTNSQYQQLLKLTSPQGKRSYGSTMPVKAYVLWLKVALKYWWRHWKTARTHGIVH